MPGAMPDAVAGVPELVVRAAMSLARAIGHPAVLAKASHPYAVLPWRAFDSWKPMEPGYRVHAYVRPDGTIRVVLE